MHSETTSTITCCYSNVFSARALSKEITLRRKGQERGQKAPAPEAGRRVAADLCREQEGQQEAPQLPGDAAASKREN